MRYLVRFGVLLALVVSPVNVVAQTTHEAGSDERPQLALLLIPEHLQERLPQDRHEPVPGEALELRKETDRQVKRAKIGLYTSSGVASGGFVLGIAAGVGYLGSCMIAWEEPCYGPRWVAPVGWTGVALASIGIVGQIASGIVLARRKRELEKLKYTHDAAPHRVRWEPAQLRLVF